MVLSLDWWYLEMEPGLFLSMDSFVLRLQLRLFGELQFRGGEGQQTAGEVGIGGGGGGCSVTWGSLKHVWSPITPHLRGKCNPDLFL